MWRRAEVCDPDLQVTEEPGGRGQEVGHRNGAEMWALFKIKYPQSRLNAAAESSVTDGCAADEAALRSSAIKAVITVTHS